MLLGRRFPSAILIIALFVMLAAGVGIARQQPNPASSAATAPLNQAIPVDPSITTGRFANGLKYYIRKNAKPEDRAELRLALNAGSVLEDDDQRGLAHFVEHMAFNGTKNFPKLDIVNFVQSIGMRFGNDLNAYTSFDETVYQLQVPTDKPEVLERAMLILGDWAQNVTFDPAEIDKERGVVLEEWRLGRGAEGRLRDKQFPVILQGSRYADRLPIGTPEILRNFSHSRLIQYYKDWYRPDLMAVVAVGDFEVPAIEALIKKHFEPIPAAVSPRPRPAYPVPDHPGTNYAIATDPELQGTSVSVYHTMPARDQSTVGAYRQQLIVEQLFTNMLNERYQEIALKPGAPFLGAGAGIGAFVRTADASSLSAGVKEGGVEAGLDSLFTEAARVAKFGFTASEFERAKTNALRRFERLIAEKDNQTSAPLAAEYIRNFTTTEPIPGIAYEYELYKRFLPQISLNEMNALARLWAPDRNRVVVVSAPEKAGVTQPTQARLAAVMTAAAAKDLTAYADTTTTAPLLAAAPKPGSIVSTTNKEQFGITEWTLSNGATVVLKPTTFKQDEILLRAFSPGGTSLASDQDFVSAQTAGQVAAAGGLGQFSAIDLRRVLTGKAASVGPAIGEVSEELSGSASPKDLETMFQLLYMRFTAPREDPTIFQVMKEQTKIALANQQNSPDFAFHVAMTEAMWGNHPRARPMTPARVDEMNLEKSMTFYKDRYKDASDFTFVFVGAFDLATMRPFVEKYVASLPSIKRTETWRNVDMHRATGVVSRRVNKGIEPKSDTVITFSGPFQYDQKHRIDLRMLTMVLEGRLREALREDLGGTYGVSVSPGFSKIPRQEYTVTVSFGSAPDRADALVDTIFKKIDELKITGPNERELASFREILLRDYESNTKTNGFFMREIATRYQFGEDVSALFNLPRFYNALTPGGVQDTAKQYLNTNNYVKVQLFPEK